ncbi:hypothetical protein [Virgibacillus litoralis]|uniref:Uncharacterized protein n=1 Tax=Virgibacillus litoralis TaxID=578221 RepID=A0ABS4HFH9_9BACI|nr:hypothetical protein [Virgibacillus litoralis]MBP1949677.1 hypothetical protein [Virgibacillus litoralis]
MYYLFLSVTFLFLIILIVREGKEKENLFWGKIVLLFLTFLLSLNIGFVYIPIGIAIAFFIVIKYSRYNLSLKKLTLLFSLIGFLLVNYVIPPIEFSNILYSKEINTQINNFEDVEDIAVFENDSSIQRRIKKYGKDSSNIMFRYYVLMQKGISVNDKEWLLYDSHDELNYYWLSQTTKSESVKTGENSTTSYGVAWKEYIRFNETGEEYIGIFEKENGKVYLKYVIKGMLKNGQAPKSIFDLF